VLASAMPIGMTSAFFVARLGGDASLALVLTTATTLFTPFLVPVVMQFLVGEMVVFNLLDLSILLAELIFLPFFLSSLLRRMHPEVSEKLLENSKDVNNLLIFLIVWAMLAPVATHIYDIVILLPAVAIIMALSFVMGYYTDFNNRMTNSVSLFRKNATLGAVVAAQSFGPVAVLPSIAFVLLQNIAISALIFGKVQTSTQGPRTP